MAVQHAPGPGLPGRLRAGCCPVGREAVVLQCMALSTCRMFWALEAAASAGVLSTHCRCRVGCTVGCAVDCMQPRLQH